MYIVMGDKLNAINKVRELFKSASDLKLFETPSFKYIITERTLSEYQEIKFQGVSINEIRKLEEY